MRKSYTKFKALEMAGEPRFYLRGQYRFWRRAGLAPWCALRHVIQYRMGLL